MRRFQQNRTDTVDDSIEATVAGVDFLDQFVDSTDIGRIDPMSFTTPEIGGEGIKPIAPASRNDHRRPVRGQPSSHLRTDAAGSSEDHVHFLLIHTISSTALTVDRSRLFGRFEIPGAHVETHAFRIDFAAAKRLAEEAAVRALDEPICLSSCDRDADETSALQHGTS
jgi:hypothetical protein